MKKKRILYSLRNCNPPERKKRDRINRMDFQKVFPYYSFDKNKIDINLLRRFIIQNNIPCDLPSALKIVAALSFSACVISICF